MKKRLLSVLLTVAMCTSLLPTAAFAADGTTTPTGDQTIMWGTSGIANPVAPSSSDENALYTYDYVYYGNYKQTSNGGSGYNTDPIKWRVLDADNSYKESENGENKNGLFLLSDIVLDQQVWNRDSGGEQYRNYGTSYIRDWLNGTTSGKFLYDAFSGGEQAGISTTYVETKDVEANEDPTNIFKTTPTADKIFLLSNEDVQNKEYGFGNDASRISRYSAYAKKEGVYVDADEDGAKWWLRSPGSYDYNVLAAHVYGHGIHGYGGDGVDSNNTGVRPAFHLDRNSVLFTSAAAGGKSDTVDAALTASGAYTGNEWKVTLLDSGRSGFTASVSSISGDDVIINYSGAATGNNEFISAIIKSYHSDEVKYYGRLAQVTSDNGTVTLTLPSDFDVDTDMLCVFNEQYNGDYMTDYASQPIQMIFCVIKSTDLNFSGDVYAYRGQDYTATLTAPTGDSNTVYRLPDDVRVTIGNTELVEGEDTFFFDRATGALTIHAAAITDDITIYATAKKYAVEVTNSDGNYDFGTETYGYSSVTARTMTIKNMGNQTLAVTLPDASSDSFDITFSSAATSLAPGETLTVTVKPKDGLNASTSTYTKDLEIGITGASTNDLKQTISASFTVNKAEWTGGTTATGETKYGTTGTVDLTALLADGFVLGEITKSDNDSVLADTPTVSKGVLTFKFKNDQSLINKTAAITVPVTSSTNYKPYNIVVTVTVLDKNAQTVSFANASVSKTYGDAPFTVAATHSVGDGAVTYESSDTDVATVDGNGKVSILKASDTPVTITATTAETTDYSEASASYTLTVGKKALTVQPKAVTVYVNASEPTFELAYSGLVGTDSTTPSEAPTFKVYKSDGTTEISAADAVKTAGTYIIKWENKDATTFAGAGNYDITKAETAELKVNTRPSTGGGSTPPTPPSTPVTVAISGDENSIDVDASVQGDKATIDEVDLDHLDTVIGEDVQVGVVTIDFSTLDKELTVVEIPADMVHQIADAVADPNNNADSLEVVFSDGTSIEFDAVALGEKSAQAGGLDITISILPATKAEVNDKQKNAIGGRPFYDISVTSGGEHISDMGGKITVHVPYELKKGEKAEGIVVYYVDEYGNKERCETSYDSQKKRVNWKTDHLSLYMIAYEEVETPVQPVVPAENPFKDVSETDWFYNAVMFVYENGLMSGVDENHFGPYWNTTRGMITTIIWRLEGKPAAASLPFADVDADMYYADAIAWAAENGIVSGYDSVTFGPDDNITREQLASILWRYAKYKGYDVSVGEDTNILSYEDAFSISEYAIPAMQWACGAGIISGNDDGTLNPTGYAQRAHAAQMLMKFMNNTVE